MNRIKIQSVAIIFSCVVLVSQSIYASEVIVIFGASKVDSTRLFLNAVPLEFVSAKQMPKEIEVIANYDSIRWVFEKGEKLVDFNYIVSKQPMNEGDTTTYRKSTDLYLHFDYPDNSKMVALYRAKIHESLFFLYPVKKDPVQRSLIWIGCNASLRNASRDYIKRAKDELLDCDYPIGGLIVIDTKYYTISYFGSKYLIDKCVFEIIFDPYDPNSVWIWGKCPEHYSNDGLVRYDRDNRQFFQYLSEMPMSWKNNNYTSVKVDSSYVTITDEIRTIRFNKKDNTWLYLDY